MSTKRGATDCRVNNPGGFNEMRSAIVQLDPCDFERCSAIWDITGQPDLAELFKQDLIGGNRITFIYLIDGNPVGEISIVFDANDVDYTVLDRLFTTTSEPFVHDGDQTVNVESHQVSLLARIYMKPVENRREDMREQELVAGLHI